MNADQPKTIRVADVVSVMDNIAPPYLAQEWDNVGLQVGSVQWKVHKIWIALDPLLDVIEDAGRHQVDMVITHHPLIFTSLENIDLESNVGKVIDTALRTKTAIFAAHTNLDSAADGLNDELARRLGLRNLQPLVEAGDCGEQSDNPAGSMPTGLGRIGEIATPQILEHWVKDIKKRLGLNYVRVAGNVMQRVQRVAVCSGSGGSLIKDFLDSGADVYVSGDLKYHDARIVEEAGRAFIDIGHFASEHIVVTALAEKLNLAVQACGWDVQIEACLIEQDPLTLM